MIKTAFLSIITLMLFACSAPVPQQAISVTRPTEDTIQTIVLSEPDTVETEVIDSDTLALLVLTKQALHVSDVVSIYDGLGDVPKRISVNIKDGKVSYLEIDNNIYVGEPKVYSKLLKDGRIKVLHGATLEYLARFYNTSIQNLLRCNPEIGNPDYIQSNTILRLNCKCYECPKVTR